MLLRYAGFDPTERQILKTTAPQRGASIRFTREQIDTMIQMADDGASSLEIGKAIERKPEAIRAKLCALGFRLRKRVTRLRIRLVVPATKRMYAAAEERGITVQALIRRLLRAISKNDLFDELLPIPVPHSLGAAAVNEPGRVVSLIRCPELAGCAPLLAR